MKTYCYFLVVLFTIAPPACTLSVYAGTGALQAGEPIFIPVKIDGPAHDPACRRVGYAYRFAGS